MGRIVLANRGATDVMDRWIEHDDIWIARTAILHQNRWKNETDEDRLFRYCERRAGDTEFFVRKAIGWALREYSKTDASAVRAFVALHDSELSGLSKREALKWLERNQSEPQPARFRVRIPARESGRFFRHASRADFSQFRYEDARYL